MWSTEPSGEMEKASPAGGRGRASFIQMISGWGLPVGGGKQLLALRQSFSMREHSLTEVTVLELFWEAGAAQSQSYHGLDGALGGCWMSQREEGKLS